MQEGGFPSLLDDNFRDNRVEYLQQKHDYVFKVNIIPYFSGSQTYN